MSRIVDRFIGRVRNPVAPSGGGSSGGAGLKAWAPKKAAVPLVPTVALMGNTVVTDNGATVNVAQQATGSSPLAAGSALDDITLDTNEQVIYWQLNSDMDAGQDGAVYVIFSDGNPFTGAPAPVFTLGFVLSRDGSTNSWVVGDMESQLATFTDADIEGGYIGCSIQADATNMYVRLYMNGDTSSAPLAEIQKELLPAGISENQQMGVWFYGALNSGNTLIDIDVFREPTMEYDDTVQLSVAGGFDPAFYPENPVFGSFILEGGELPIVHNGVTYRAGMTVDFNGAGEPVSFNSTESPVDVSAYANIEATWNFAQKPTFLGRLAQTLDTPYQEINSNDGNSPEIYPGARIRDVSDTTTKSYVQLTNPADDSLEGGEIIELIGTPNNAIGGLVMSVDGGSAIHDTSDDSELSEIKPAGDERVLFIFDSAASKWRAYRYPKRVGTWDSYVNNVYSESRTMKNGEKLVVQSMSMYQVRPKPGAAAGYSFSVVRASGSTDNVEIPITGADIYFNGKATGQSTYAILPGMAGIPHSVMFDGNNWHIVATTPAYQHRLRFSNGSASLQALASEWINANYVGINGYIEAPTDDIDETTYFVVLANKDATTYDVELKTGTGGGNWYENGVNTGSASHSIYKGQIAICWYDGGAWNILVLGERSNDFVVVDAAAHSVIAVDVGKDYYVDGVGTINYFQFNLPSYVGLKRGDKIRMWVSSTYNTDFQKPGLRRNGAELIMSHSTNTWLPPEVVNGPNSSSLGYFVQAEYSGNTNIGWMLQYNVLGS